MDWTKLKIWRRLPRLVDFVKKIFTGKAARLTWGTFGAIKRVTFPALEGEPGAANLYPLDDDRAPKHVQKVGRTPVGLEGGLSGTTFYPLCYVDVPQGFTFTLYEIQTLIALAVKVGDPSQYLAQCLPVSPWQITDVLGLPSPYFALRTQPLDAPLPVPISVVACPNAALLLGDPIAEGLEFWNDSRFAWFRKAGSYPLKITVREKSRLILWGYLCGNEPRSFSYLAGSLVGQRWSHRRNPEAVPNIRRLF